MINPVYILIAFIISLILHIWLNNAFTSSAVLVLGFVFGIMYFIAAKRMLQEEIKEMEELERDPHK